MWKTTRFFSFRIDDKATPKKLGFAVITVWCISGLSLFWFKEDRGTIGDMFGAVNALFSGLAFAGIIYTILLQREELGQQREELRMTRAEFEQQNKTLKFQRFETSFFNLLSARREIMQSLTLEANGGRINGVAVIVFINNQLSIRLENRHLPEKITESLLEELREQYFAIVHNSVYSNQIGLFLESLLSLLNFVANSDLIEHDGNRSLYISIISSHLTDAERTFLYYYLCLDWSTAHITHNHYHRIENRFHIVNLRGHTWFHESHSNLWEWWKYLHDID